MFQTNTVLGSRLLMITADHNTHKMSAFHSTAEKAILENTRFDKLC